MAELVTKWFETTDSTNVRIACDKQALPDGSVYAALFQTAGRGQRGNRWEGRKGENIMLSILFKPEGIKMQDQFIISEIAAVGTVRYLNSRGLSAKVKWPNDIYVGDRKICGILIENSVADAKLSASIVGIGLNLNQEVFASDAPNPTSLTLQTGVRYDLRVETDALLEEVFGLYRKVMADPEEAGRELGETYLDMMYRRGEWHDFERLPSSDIPTEKRSGEKFRGRILGISKTACLLVELTDGSIDQFAFKEIKYVI